MFDTKVDSKMKKTYSILFDTYVLMPCFLSIH